LSPGWITRQTEECLRTGGEREATRLVEALLPSWQETVLHHESGELLSPVLRLASSVGSSHLATSLLKPFHLKALAEPHAAAVAELLRHYGASWFCALLASWREQSRFSARDSDSEAWIAELPRLAKRLLVADEQHGTEAARRILEDRWSWLKGALESAVTCETPKWRQERLAVLARSAFAFVLAAGIVGVPELLGQALDFLRDPSHEELLPLVLKVLEYARSEPGISRSSEAGIAELRGHAIQELRRRLSVPARKPEDWSIDWPRHCRCELCGTLARFLASPTQRVHEWPLATEGRRHVHGAIDSRELPVTHVTRRSGRPYTLILTKTQELFAREATARKLWEKALRSLTGSSKS
ncbi:MAG: hypothetical protein HY303_10260, partial [Candidatus Wallbacteria bacterium]|nr:hypothetical protein [Candidatus Wallbacteria bacterium]